MISEIDRTRKVFRPISDLIIIIFPEGFSKTDDRIVGMSKGI